MIMMMNKHQALQPTLSRIAPARPDEADADDDGAGGGSAPAPAPASDSLFGVEYRRRPNKSEYKLPSGPAFADEAQFEKEISIDITVKLAAAVASPSSIPLGHSGNYVDGVCTSPVYGSQRS